MSRAENCASVFTSTALHSAHANRFFLLFSVLLEPLRASSSALGPFRSSVLRFVPLFDTGAHGILLQRSRDEQQWSRDEQQWSRDEQQWSRDEQQ
jgi:hypothetical protein